MPENLESKIKYKFKKKKLLNLALSHSSYANEHKSQGYESNERLEFLGDSVLGVICAELLYNEFSGKAEGDLTKIRASMVCEPALFNYAKSIDLGSYLMLGHGEESSGGRERPSILADSFEALIAAIFLDGGIESAKAFVLPFLKSAMPDKNHTDITNDYKTMLQEIAQKNPGEIIHYKVINETGPDHDKKFDVEVYLNSNVIGRGSGKSKKEAEQSAAKKALKLMGEPIQ